MEHVVRAQCPTHGQVHHTTLDNARHHDFSTARTVCQPNTALETHQASYVAPAYRSRAIDWLQCTGFLNVIVAGCNIIRDWHLKSM